jgi:hypothetical protein
VKATDAANTDKMTGQIVMNLDSIPTSAGPNDGVTLGQGTPKGLQATVSMIGETDKGGKRNSISVDMGP